MQTTRVLTGAEPAQQRSTAAIRCLEVTDNQGNHLANCICTLTDKNNTQIFQVTTDVNGQIATQTINRDYYDQAHGSVLQDSSPRTLTVTKTGYMPLTKVFTFNEKVKWIVTMLSDALDITAEASEIRSGKTAYVTSNQTKVTGTYESRLER